MTANLPASIHARLLNHAKTMGEDFNQVLARYATERFLYRLSTLPAREEFWLKGAKLFDLWFNVPHRPKRDAELRSKTFAKTLVTAGSAFVLSADWAVPGQQSNWTLAMAMR